jgi:hypothetical protein
MTEAEWLEGDSSGLMIEHAKRVVGLSPKVRGRKYRLAAIAMVRRFLDREPMPDLIPVLEAAERLCDDRCSLADVGAAIGAGDFLARSNIYPNWGMIARHLGETESFGSLRGLAGATQLGPMPPGTLRSPFVALQCRVLRDVFGNPFRPVSFSAEWRTDTAIALARTVYDSRDFSAMPILADALQDAGCDSDDVLNHCRDANQVHVRGCWVVDLVLGKA